MAIGDNQTGGRRPRDPANMRRLEALGRFVERWGGPALTLVEWLAFTAVALGFVLLLFVVIAG